MKKKHPAKKTAAKKAAPAKRSASQKPTTKRKPVKAAATRGKAGQGRTAKKSAQRAGKPPTPDAELQYRGLVEPDFPFIDGLLAQMRAGKTTATVAARFLGIPEETFAQWLVLGKRDAGTGLRSMFAYLHSVVDAGDAGVELGIIERVAASRDWRALVWLAERRWPLRYDGALIRLNLMKPTESRANDEPYDWRKAKPVMPEQTVAVLRELEALFVAGNMPLEGIPQNPHDLRDESSGLRSVIAFVLWADIERGVLYPAHVVDQVREFVSANLPPPQEEQSETATGGENAMSDERNPASAKSGETGQGKPARKG